MDPALLDILVCPVTHNRLRQEGDFLIAEPVDPAASVGGLKYPIRDGIPVLLASEAILPEGINSLEEFKQKIKSPRP